MPTLAELGYTSCDHDLTGHGIKPGNCRKVIKCLLCGAWYDWEDQRWKGGTLHHEIKMPNTAPFTSGHLLQ